MAQSASLVTAVSSVVLVVGALAVLAAFPRAEAVRFWSSSWVLLGAAFGLGSLGPTWVSGTPGAFVPTAVVHLSNLGFVLGLSHGLPVPWGASSLGWVRNGLWAGTVGVLLLLAFDLGPVPAGAASVWAGLVWALGAGVVAAGYRPGWSWWSLAAALVVGQGPFLVSCQVLGPGGGSLGFPPLAVVAAGLAVGGLAFPLARDRFAVSPDRGPYRTIVVDGLGRVTFADFGPAADDPVVWVGRPLAELGTTPSDKRILEPLARLTTSDWEGPAVLGPRGTRVHLVYRRQLGPDRAPAGAVLLVRDRFLAGAPVGPRFDPVTGLPSRWWTLELLGIEAVWARVTGTELSGLRLELEDLDLVERQFGPEAADDLLRRLGELATRCLRKTDVCGRVGPRTLAVALPGTPAPKALTVAERLARTFAVASDAEALGARLRVTPEPGMNQPMQRFGFEVR